LRFLDLNSDSLVIVVFVMRFIPAGILCVVVAAYFRQAFPGPIITGKKQRALY